MIGPAGRPEYSSLAKWGDRLWAWSIDPILRTIIGNDDTTALRRIRAGIQLTVLAALVLLPISPFWNTAHMLTASGLLFDIAGATRVFLLEEIDNALAGYEVEDENNPSAATRELIRGHCGGEDKQQSHQFLLLQKARSPVSVLRLRSANDCGHRWVNRPIASHR
jgi:hypothetical protein